MAVKNIAVTDTLETFRTTFNDLAANDFGDPALLSGAGISATSVIGAVIELSSIVSAGQAFYIEDISSTVQLVGAGQTLKFLGTANQTNATVSVPDTLTVSLTDDVTITNDLTVTNNLTASGSTHTLGTIEVSGNTLRSIDSTRINVNDTFRANALETTTGAMIIDELGSFPRIRSTRSDDFLIFDAIPTFNSTIIFEGSSADANETTITVTNPTEDRTITIPDASGTVVLEGSSNSITSAMIVDGTITGSDIDADTITEANMADDAIGQDQLKSVVNLQILNSSGGVLKSLYGAGA